MRSQKKGDKRFSPWKRKRRLLSGLLAISLLLNPMGPVSGIFSGGKTEAASYLPIPASADYTLLNKRTASKSASAYRNISIGDEMDMRWAGSTGGAWSAYQNGFDWFRYARVNGRNGSWSATFENKKFQGTTNGDMVCRMGGYVTNYDGSIIYLGNGSVTGEGCTESGQYASDWLPYNGVKAVISGSGNGFVEHMWFVLADLTAPGEKGWDMQVIEDPDEGIATLWLSCGEVLRPVHDTITLSDLARLKLRLGLVPRKNPGAEPVYVTAEAVKYKDDGSALGFRVNEREWSALAGQEYQIVSIQDATAEGTYLFGNIDMRRPIVDLAGNAVYFPREKQNVRAKCLFLDVQGPQVAALKLSGTAVDASTKDLPDQWPADIDRSSLFSTTGDRLELRLQLSEVIPAPSQEDMKKIYLTWKNVSGSLGNRISRLLKIEQGYANGVNGDIVSTLVFEPITVAEDHAGYTDFQGKRIGADKLYGGEYLLDYSKNAMSLAGQPFDLSGIGTDCQNYLDTRGPAARMEQVLTVSQTDQEAYYIIPLHIQDGDDGALAAGMEGQMGQIALTSYAGAPQMKYAYEISGSQEIPDTLSQEGTIGGEGNEIWSPFRLTGDGTYYLHVKLSNLQGKELSDTQGLTLKLQLLDVLGNRSQHTFTWNNLGLDQTVPELTLTEKGIEVSAADGINQAVLKALAQCSDLNGIDRMEYQWVNTGEEAAANAWTAVASDRQQFTDTVEGLSTVSRDLIVRAYDKYDNVTEKRITMTADLSRAVGQFYVSGDPETPSVDTDVFLSKPASTGVLTEQACTRATVQIGGNTYVRIFKSDDPVSLLDWSAGDWYQVTISNGTYGSVTEQATPDETFYGKIQVALASSLTDLTPVAGAAVNADSDVTLSQDGELTIAYAPANENVHNVSFAKNITDSAGKRINSTTKSGYTYYKFEQTMTGTRIPFTVSNTKMAEWTFQNIDFDRSYAVLIKADQEGVPLDEEASARVSLSGSTEQVFSVPAQDKDGKAFKTGAYVLKVCVTQKAGGEQTFYAPIPLLLDATGMPSQFGVLSYESTVRTTFASTDNYDSIGIQRNQTAPAGEVLHTINVGVAKPDGYGLANVSSGSMKQAPGTIKKIGGHDAYLTEIQNSLRGSRYEGTGGQLQLDIWSQWNADEDPGKWMGVRFGKAKGIKFWNAASQGDPADLPYEDTGYTGDTSIGIVHMWDNVKWYDEDVNSCVVSREELAAKSLDDFALALGSNTICYQLVLENGYESPIYDMEINLCDQAPELELEYSFGPSVIEKQKISDGTTVTKKFAEYVDVSVKDAFSAYGGLTLYHAHYDAQSNVWSYDEITADTPVRMTKGGNGTFGFIGTNTGMGSSYGDLEFTTREFICAVDSVGNAVSAYPILRDGYNTQQDQYYYGIDANCGFFDTTEPRLSMDGYTYSMEFSNASDARLDYYTIQVDDRTPERIDSSITGWHFEDIPSTAGLTYASKNRCSFVLPYDPNQAEGASVTHKVKLKAYGYRENEYTAPMEKTVEYEITAINQKPHVEVDTESYTQSGQAMEPGSVWIKTNTDVQEQNWGISYGSSYMRAYKNGTYWLNLKDKYGEQYLQELTIDGLPEDPVIDISTTEPTTGPVIITVTSDRYLLDTSARSGVSAQQQPQVTGDGTKEMTITVPENCQFDLYWGETADTLQEHSTHVTVNNINNEEITPVLRWCYDEEMVEEGNILRGDSLRVVLEDANGRKLIDPQTGGMPYYDFVAGGETEHTFSGYVNEYGKVGPDLTAVLPVTLVPYESETEDAKAPNLAISGYVSRQGKSSEVAAVYLQMQDGTGGYGYENAYGPENIYTDMDAFLTRMSWANSYTLRVAVEDQSAVRLFVKREQPDTAPDYVSGVSDSIEGVTLTGRTLQITRNVEFFLYAVDERGNYSMVPVRVTELGDLPVPECVKVRSKIGDVVKLYLMQPELEGIGRFQITNDDNNDDIFDALTEEDVSSAFYGRPYLPVTKNGTVILRYSYDYLGAEVTGSITIDVSEIDTAPASVTKTSWSANYDPSGKRYTNQEISAQMQFDRILGDVVLLDEENQELPLVIADAVTVSWLEDRVTVVYDNNMPGLRLKVTAAVSRLETVVDLPEIDTIDRDAPNAAVNPIEYSSDHRSAVVTITSDEEGILNVTGKKGTSFRQTVKENGTYDYIIADRAGNQSQVSAVVDGLVTEELTLLLSTGGSDDSVIDPEVFEAKVGDKLFVKANRQVSLYMNGSQIMETMEADTWSEITVDKDSEGLYPSIRAVDAYGNAAVVQLLRIPMGDRKPPVLLLAKKQISASTQKTDEELRELLLANVTCSDETTPVDRLTVTAEFDRSSTQSRIPVTYTVTDEAGNQTTANGWLRLKNEKEPAVMVNDSAIEWDETMAVQPGSVKLHVVSCGEPYKICWKAGIKTEGQLKIGSHPLGSEIRDNEKDYELELTEPGYYTFCITTQGRASYRFVLYVEE